MAKSLHGGGVDFPIRATTDQLRSDLEQGKSMVRQAAQEMRGTANVSLANPAQLGPAAASATFDANVQAKMARMQEKSLQRTENMRIASAARRNLGIMTASEARGMMGDRYGPSLADIEAAGAAEQRAGAKSAMAERMAARSQWTQFLPHRVASLARFAGSPAGMVAGAAVAGTAALYGVDREMRSRFAAAHAFRDASDRFSFQGRNAFNDPTLRMAAGAQGDLAGRGGVFGSIVDKLPIAGALFAEKLERAARSADRIANSYQQAVTSRQGSEMALARLTGRPLDALAKEHDIAMRTAQGKVSDAERELLKIRSEPGWGTSDKWEARIAAARTTRDKTVLSKISLEKEQEAERGRETAVFNASRYGITAGERSETFRGAELAAGLRNDTMGGFAAQRMQQNLAMEQAFEERLASVKGDPTATIQIENQRIQARANFAMESKLQLRQMAVDNTGAFMSTSEGARFAQANRMQFAMENANLDTAVLDALRALPEAMNNLAGVLSRTPLLGQPN